MSDKEFWGLTLRRFDELYKQYKAEQERTDARFALVAWSIWENSRLDFNLSKKPYKIEQFMLSRPAKKKQTPEQLAVFLEVLTEVMGGEIKGIGSTQDSYSRLDEYVARLESASTDEERQAIMQQIAKVVN